VFSDSSFIYKGEIIKGKLLRKYIGGEAIVEIYENVVLKKRIPKRYRIKELDTSLRKKRTKTEVKLMSLARKQGVATPIVLDVVDDTIVMERIDGLPVRDILNEEICKSIGRDLAKMHNMNIVHGDVTPMNLILKENRIYFVDFGLAFIDSDIEPKGVDLHIFFEALRAYYDNWENLKKAFLEGYLELGDKDVIDRAEEIAERGRYVKRVSQI